jgi:leader peptidase (prepilin peptidase) / N-methyltransferase
MHLDTALVCAAIGTAGGWFVPVLIARLPEPDPEPDPEPAAVAEREAQAPAEAKEPEEPKELYADLAALPGLAWRCALAAGVAAGLIGLTLGWVWPLTYLVYLCPVAVALAFVDFRTYLLPTRIIAPSYGVVLALILVSFAFDHDADDLVRAAIGWAVTGLLYVLLWFFTPGMGYGDVRLSGVLGLALGYLGWGELLVGIYSGFLLGGLGWFVLRLLGVTRNRHYPAGPFMMIGALVGVVWGADVWGYLVAHRS